MKYSKKRIKTKNNLKSKKKQFYGGAISDNYDSLITNLTQIINNREQLQKFSENMIRYYDLKINKYFKLINTKSSDINTKFIIDINNKKEIQSIIQNIDPNVVNDYAPNIKHFDRYLTDALEQNFTIIRYKNIINEIVKKKKELQNLEKLKTEMEKFVELSNKLNTDNMNYIRIEILEYLTLISKGSILLDVYKPFNFILKGQPGIGKSYNAEKIANLLAQSQLLCFGNIKYIKKPDIIGQYVGQTAPKVYNRLSNGLESVIFIDEAYSIAGKKKENGYDQYGQEALDALTDFTSEHQGLISVIAAGYPSEMQTQFLDCNPGLPRRFPLVYHLQRYHLKDILNISFKTGLDILANIPNFDGILGYGLLSTMMNFFVSFLWNFDFTLNNNLFNEIVQTKKNFFDNNIKSELQRLGCTETIKDYEWKNSSGIPLRVYLTPESILGNNSTIFIVFNYNDKNYTLPILFCENNIRKPFYYQKTNTGIEWFFLVYILSKVTNLPDGDFFKFQAADIKNYTEIYINSYILTQYDPIRPISDFNSLFDVSINSIFNEKNISIQYDNNNTYIIDTYNYVSNSITDYSIIPENQGVEVLLQVLFKDMLVVFNKLIELNEETSDRLFTIFNMNQLQSMKKTINDFTAHINNLPKNIKVLEYLDPTL